MTRSLILAAATLGGLIMTAGMASAMPLSPETAPAPARSALVQHVAWGCGPGWHPDYWGRCVPNVFVPVPVYHYYGWGWRHPAYGYYHHGWGHPHPVWRHGWRR